MFGPFLAVAALVTIALLARSHREGTSTTSAADPSLPPAPPPVDVAPGVAAQHKAAAPVVAAAFRQVVGRDPSLAERQYIQGVAWLETNYGHGWGAAMANAHNWGAVSCNPATMSAAECVPGQTDHTSGGAEYTTGFRAYPDDVSGAADVVKQIIKNRPETRAALAKPNPTAMDASLAMRREHYYGGICNAAKAKYGEATATASFATPDRDEGTQACARETTELHADTVMRNATAIAQSVGEPLALRRGDYDQSLAWYRAQNPPKAVA